MIPEISSILALGRETSFDRTTALVARLLEVPVALISFVDESRQAFKSQVGLPEPWATTLETPLSHSFCRLVVASGEPLRVTDAKSDARVCDNLAVSDLGVVSYLGAPLRLGSGDVIGALCAIDSVPREWKPHELATLEDLAAGVVGEIELRTAVRTESEGRRALSEAQRLLGMAEEFAGIGRWSVELPSLKLFWSPHVFSIYGLEPADEAPDVATAISAYHPDDRHRVQTSVRDAIETGKPFEHFCRLQRPDGSLRHVLSKGEPNVDPAGIVTGISGIFLDVTDLKVTEGELRRHSQVLEATLDNMEQGLVMIAPDGTIQTYNRRFCELLDIPGSVMLASSQFDDVLAWLLANGEYANLSEDEQARIGSRGAPLTIGTYERLRPNGRWLEISTVPLRQGGVVRTYTDVTEKWEADASRRVLQEQFRIIAENSGDLITVKPRFDGPRAYVSPSVKRILGFEPEDFRLLSPDSIIHPDDLPGLRQAVEPVGAGGPSVTLVYRMRRKDGGWVWMESTWASSYSPIAGQCMLVTGRDVTERVEIERARVESEARYRLLAEGTSDVITKLNLDLRREYVSPSCVNLLGYTPQEMLGARPAATMHPDDIPLFGEITRKLIMGKSPAGQTTITNRMRHKDGRWIWIEARLTLAMDVETGLADSIICSLRDVTERKLAEDALAESEARYRLLAESTSDVITELDLDFQRVYVSPSCRKLLGYEPEEMLGRQPSGSMHPDDAQGVRRLALQLVAGELDTASATTTTYRMRHKSGHWVWVEAVLTLVADSVSGAPASIVCSLRDVNARKLAELAVAESESRFRLLAEHASDMIILADLDTTRRYVSPASVDILGYRPDELLGSKPLAGVHPEDLDQYARLLTALQRGDVETGSNRQRYRHKDGRWVWVEAIFRLLRAGDGAPTGYVAAVRDISERHRHESELKAAMAAAEAASRAKTDFLATMSHEIRTPLNGILGFTDMLLDAEDLSTEHRRKVSRIQSAGSALLTVVNDVLDFSKIEAGQIDIAEEAFSVRALLDNAASIVKGLAEAKKLKLTVDCGVGVPDRVIGDEARVRQVLLNFLNNAIKFTSEGEIAVTVFGEGGKGKSRAIRFAVSDTGIGIPSDKRDRLFQRFSQVDGSIARTYGGTGLGLAISKHLVELMGGEIGVHSEEGEGSTFWFRIKLAEAPASDDAASTELVALPGRSLKILLAEDLEINQEIAVSALRKLGHDVDVVPDGASAVMAAESRRYDAILMDVQMPVMDGIAATKEIRIREAGGNRVPIIAMTANVLPGQIAAFRTAGMDGHIGKPFKRADLAKVLEPYCARDPVIRVPQDDVVVTAAPVFDEAAFAELEDALGAENARALLLRLESQVSEARRWSPDMGREALGAAAHKLVSPTGMLGFLRLSECCQNLEAACMSGDTAAAALGELNSALEEALVLMRKRSCPSAEAA